MKIISALALALAVDAKKGKKNIFFSTNFFDNFFTTHFFDQFFTTNFFSTNFFSTNFFRQHYILERTPDWRVNQLAGKIEDVMDNHFGRYGRWSAKMVSKSRDLADQMIADFEKKSAYCEEQMGSGEGSGDSDGEWMDERADR